MKFDPSDMDPEVLGERVRELEQLLRESLGPLHHALRVLGQVYEGKHPAPVDVVGAVRLIAMSIYLFARQVGSTELQNGAIGTLTAVDPAVGADTWRRKAEEFAEQIERNAR